MLRILAAAGAIILGTAQTGETGTLRPRAADLCGTACRNAASTLPSTQDAMAAKFVGIAARATLPHSGSFQLTDGDRVALLLLFSLQNDGKRRNP